MYLVTNSVSAQQVEETDDAYIIRDVPIVKPMELSEGYVPEWSIKETANEWNKTVPTLNHPRNSSGEPIAANRKPELHLGNIQNSRFDGEFVRSNIKIDKAELESLGGEADDIKQALENGEKIDVSTQYRAEPLPPGEYDGKHRQNVERIVEPDSVAILPNKRGKCSVESGCGINPQMVANSDLSIPMTEADDPTGEDSGKEDTMKANQIEQARTPTFDGTTTGEWSKPDFNEYVEAFGFDAEQVSDLSQDQRQQIAETTLLGDPEADTFDNLQFFPVVEPDSMDLSENALMAVLSGRGAQADISESQLESARNVSRTLLEDEFDRDMTDNSAFNKVISGLKAAFGVQTANEAGGNSGVETEGSDMDREKLIEDITTNSVLTESSLTDRCDDGLEKLHSDVMEANESDDPDGDNPEEVVMTENELESLIEDKAEKIVANREAQTKKEKKAQAIVANSNEYEDTETVLEDYPTEAALETKKDSLEDSATMPGSGMTGNFDGASDEPEYDVGSGVLGGSD